MQDGPLTDCAAALSARSRAFITVPSWGYPTDNAAIHEFAAAHGLPWIEDAAQAHGAVYGGRAVGAWATLSCFSTHERKLLSTGEGGFVLGDDSVLLRRVREAANYGMVLDPASPVAGACGHQPGGNMKLAAVLAGIGSAQLQRLPERVKRRTDSAAYLVRKVGRLDGTAWYAGPAGGIPNYYAAVLVAPNGVRHALARALAIRGVPSDALDYDYKPLYAYPLFAPYARPCPNAEFLAANITTVPVHEGLRRPDLDELAAAIRDAVAALRAGGERCAS